MFRKIADLKEELLSIAAFWKPNLNVEHK